MNLEQISSWCAPWNDLFSHSKLISGGVLGIHIMALVIGGGLAIAADRMTLRVAAGNASARRGQLREVRDVHGVVLIGIVLLLVSGVLLALADVETFLPSPIFWIKLSLVALLVVNGALLTRAERKLAARDDVALLNISEDAWARIRLFSICSVCLWIATAVVGIVLSNAA
ncbi:MAG TPA: hypothetical protein VGM82_10580 [Gemmatimonadaceae bacterium]